MYNKNSKRRKNKKSISNFANDGKERKQFMKHITAVLLVVGILLTLLCACTGKKDEEETSAVTTTEAEPQTTTGGAGNEARTDDTGDTKEWTKRY